MNAPRTRVQRRPVHGVLLLDKPLGLSSNQALQKAKWLLRAEKAGHTGTLDPLATGVLPQQGQRAPFSTWRRLVGSSRAACALQTTCSAAPTKGRRAAFGGCAGTSCGTPPSFRSASAKASKRSGAAMSASKAARAGSGARGCRLLASSRRARCQRLRGGRYRPVSTGRAWVRDWAMASASGSVKSERWARLAVASCCASLRSARKASQSPSGWPWASVLKRLARRAKRVATSGARLRRSASPAGAGSIGMAGVTGCESMRRPEKNKPAASVAAGRWECKRIISRSFGGTRRGDAVWPRRG